MSPVVFNPYSEVIFQKAQQLEICRRYRSIDGKKYNNICTIVDCGEEYGLSLNANKTKFTRMSKIKHNNDQKQQATIPGTRIKRRERSKEEYHGWGT